VASGISLNMGAGAGVGNAPPWLTGGASTGTSNGSSGIFGPQPSSSSSGSGSYLSALNPLHAFGLTVLSGVAAVGLLILIRQSLPR
jgi:hypothetical protein